MLSVTFLCICAPCHFAECRYAECRYASCIISLPGAFTTVKLTMALIKLQTQKILINLAPDAPNFNWN